MEITINSDTVDKLHQQLICSLCGKPLSVPPIFTGISLGSICGRCVSDLHIDEMVSAGFLQHEPTYEHVASNFEFPCCNNNIGCQALLKWGSVLDHESNCTVELDCLFQPQACTWRGNNVDMAEHILDAHKNCYESHPIMITLEKERDEIKAFFTKVCDRVFYGTLTWYSRCATVQCSIKCIHVNHKFENKFYIFEVNSLNTNENLIRRDTFSLLGRIMDKREGYIQLIIDAAAISAHDVNFDGNKMRYQIAIVRKLDEEIAKIEKEFNAINLTTKHKITQITKLFRKSNESRPILKYKELLTKLKEFENQFLELFECTRCSNYMRPPIYTCCRGHSVCSNCKNQNSICPSCDSTEVGPRNYPLENLADLVRYRCKFVELGCREILEFKDVEQHTASCFFQAISCPLENCCETVGTIKVIDHFLQKHCEIVVKAERIIEKPISTQNKSRNVIIYKNQVFLLHFECDMNTSFVKFDCAHVGFNVVKNKYVYVLKFTDITDKGLGLVIKRLCKLNYADLGENALYFSMRSLEPYVKAAGRSTLTFSCTINEV